MKRIKRNQSLLPTPNLPTKIIPTKIRRLKHSGKSPVDLRIPPLKLTFNLRSPELLLVPETGRTIR